MSDRVKKHLGRVDYHNKDGFSIDVLYKAPKEGIAADIIRLICVKKNEKGKILRSTSDYWTPDEAMSVARLLLAAVDYSMDKHWVDFRDFREKKSQPKQ